MTDTQHVLLQFWQEQRNQARQSEYQRATLTHIILVVASAAIGLVAHQGVEQRSMLLVTVPVILLGGYGVVASLKYYERFTLHMTQAQDFRRSLDEFDSTLRLEQSWSTIRTDHSRQHPVLCRIRLHYLWAGLHAGISVTGMAMTVVVAL